MIVALSPELAKLVQDQIKNGGYDDESEVVRDALRRTFQPKGPDPVIAPLGKTFWPAPNNLSTR